MCVCGDGNQMIVIYNLFCLSDVLFVCLRLGGCLELRRFWYDYCTLILRESESINECDRLSERLGY